MVPGVALLGAVTNVGAVNPPTRASRTADAPSGVASPSAHAAVTTPATPITLRIDLTLDQASRATRFSQYRFRPA
jgi:hypothetical protein